MLHNLEKFTSKYISFTTEEIFVLASIFKPLSVKENDFIIEKGDFVSNVYFLDNGVLKSYIENNNKIYKVKFYFSPIFFSDLHALNNKKESIINFIIVKNSNIFMANFQDIMKLNEKSIKYKDFFNMIFEDQYLFNSNLNK
jgi:hypothetical protein